MKDFKNGSLILSVAPPDEDNEIELNIESAHAMDGKSIWLTVDQVKELIAYLLSCVEPFNPPTIIEP